MNATLMDEEWGLLSKLLPEGWRDLAAEAGAMRRARGEITSPDALLKVLLMHVATGLSLQQAAARATVQGIASISDVALLKRLRSSEEWLRRLAQGMFKESRFSCVSASSPAGRRLRAVDATTVQEPGATGTDWRVHYCIALPDMRCDFYQITNAKGGESYKRLPVQAGDIILADRGYCHREGVAHVLREQGDVIVRLNSTNFPLLRAQDSVHFDLLDHLRGLREHKPGEWPVRFEADGECWNGRFCAVRKSRAAADLAKKKLLMEANRKQNTVRPETIECAEYVYVFTSIPRSVLNSDQVLETYRARWQIELCFKRFKSLLGLGHLPKRSDASARAWIEGKLLTVLLIERLVDEAKFFSPWGFDITAQKSLEGVY